MSSKLAAGASVRPNILLRGYEHSIEGWVPSQGFRALVTMETEGDFGVEVNSLQGMELVRGDKGWGV